MVDKTIERVDRMVERDEWVRMRLEGLRGRLRN